MAINNKVISLVLAVVVLGGGLYFFIKESAEDFIKPVEISEEQREQISQAISELKVKIKDGCKEDEAGNCYSHYLQLAINHEALGEVGRAIEANKKAIKESSNSYVPYANIGSLYRSIGELTRAEEFYKKALEINPGNLNVFRNLFEIYRYDLKMPPHELQPIFVQAITDSGNNLDFVRLYAFYLEDINDPVNAVIVLKGLLEIDPENETIKAKIAELEASARAQGLME